MSSVDRFSFTYSASKAVTILFFFYSPSVLTISVVEDEVVIQRRSARGGDFERLQGDGGCDDGVSGSDGRNNVLDDPLSQAISNALDTCSTHDTQTKWSEMVKAHPPAARLCTSWAVQHNRKPSKWS